MNRRVLLAAMLTLLAGPVLAADPAPASAKTVEVGKAFPYLAAYLKLAPGERDRFTPAYTLTRDGKPAAGVQGWIDDSGRRVPVPIDTEGGFQRLPTLAQIEAKRLLTLDVPAGTKLGVRFEIEPTLRPAAELPAGELVAAIAQATRGAKKAAGLMRMAVPTFDSVNFPGGQGGEVVLADGRVQPLPAIKGVPTFRPAAHPGARTIRFTAAPRRLRIG